jgi:hypothetical protein
MIAEMIIDTEEFLTVLKRLKPRKSTKASLAEELYIALFNGEAIFCLRGVQTRCLVEKSINWRGYIEVNSGVVLSFLAVRPAGPNIKLSVRGDVFQIENIKAPCKTMQSPEWITAMSFEAHLNDDPKAKPQTINLYCPKCGKKRGEFFKQNTVKQLELGEPPPPKYPSTRKCNACRHEWLEFTDLT